MKTKVSQTSFCPCAKVLSALMCAHLAGKIRAHLTGRWHILLSSFQRGLGLRLWNKANWAAPNKKGEKSHIERKVMHFCFCLESLSSSVELWTPKGWDSVVLFILLSPEANRRAVMKNVGDYLWKNPSKDSLVTNHPTKGQLCVVSATKF